MTVDNIQMAMQPRCVWCDVEHYMPDIIAVSRGEVGCGKCGQLSAPMTYAQYRMCRWSAFDRSGRTTAPCVTCGERQDTLFALLQHLREKHPLADDEQPPP